MTFRRFLDLTWDASLSLVFRAIFAGALYGGVNWLWWLVWDLRRHGVRAEDRDMLLVSGFIAGFAALAGFGFFRRGKVERDFSLGDVAKGHGAIGGLIAGATPRREFIRFPAFEGIFLGLLQIAIWPVFWALRENNWVLRNGAVLGAIELAWGLWQLRAPKPAPAREASA